MPPKPGFAPLFWRELISNCPGLFASRAIAKILPGQLSGTVALGPCPGEAAADIITFAEKLMVFDMFLLEVHAKSAKASKPRVPESNKKRPEN